MGAEVNDWSRAGFHLVNGKLERIEQHGKSTDIRPAEAKARKTRFLADSTGKIAKLERSLGTRTLESVQTQGEVGERFLVVVTSFRRRLLDEDNLNAKYIVDLCRYSGIIPSDAPGRTHIKVAQEKVGSKEPERVVLEIYTL